MLLSELLINADQTRHIADETIICKIAAKRYWFQGNYDPNFRHRNSPAYRVGKSSQLF